MDADFSVELGPPQAEAVLELPWDSGLPDGPRYLDLKRHPEMLPLVVEALHYPELGEFLTSVNSPGSVLETAKCDVWLEDDLAESESIYGAVLKLGAYVDLIFAAENPEARLSFVRHEQLVKALVAQLAAVSQEAAAVELIVRRCYFSSTCGEAHSGFYVTAYIFGYGEDEPAARRHWGSALIALALAIQEIANPGQSSAS